MIIGYARGSMIDQFLNLQLDALKQLGCEEIFQEKLSGAKDDRPELLQAIEVSCAGDEFVVCNLDSLAKSTKGLIEIAELLREKGVEVISIKDNMDTGTATGKGMFGMLSILAEFERDIIREQMMVGLKATRARGRKGGRQKGNQQKLKLALYHSKRMSVKEIQKATGISAATLYKSLIKEVVKDLQLN